MESKVIPILAAVISFIDTNRNLDILNRSDLQTWQVDLWMEFVNNTNLSQLTYLNTVSPKQQHELQEVAVKTTSVDGRVFSGTMPFSWLIFQQIDDVLLKTEQALKDEGGWSEI